MGRTKKNIENISSYLLKVTKDWDREPEPTWVLPAAETMAAGRIRES